eukprot:1858870-Pyramimonas_sp.AAC.1
MRAPRGRMCSWTLTSEGDEVGEEEEEGGSYISVGGCALTHFQLTLFEQLLLRTAQQQLLKRWVERSEEMRLRASLRILSSSTWRVGVGVGAK